MDKNLIKQLEELSFEKRIDTLYSLVINKKLYALSNSGWEVFFYYENDKFYLSNNGDLVETFDAPDIDIEYMIQEIEKELKNYGCYLISSRIVKEVRLDKLVEELEQFISAIERIDQMYKDICFENN